MLLRLSEARRLWRLDAAASLKQRVWAHVDDLEGRGIDSRAWVRIIGMQ